MQIIVLTAPAMVAFAANSVLARLAFATPGAEPLSYTGVRLASGAVTLGLLLIVRGGGLRLLLIGHGTNCRAPKGWRRSGCRRHIL